MNSIKKLYVIEAKIKGKPPDEILKIRQEMSVPILDLFLNWLTHMETVVLPSSPTPKAIVYTLGQWPKLGQFTKNGLVAIDNNYIEAHIRPFVIGRNAWMFSYSTKGVHTSTILYGLVETAKANGIYPHDYLHLIFKELPRSDTLEKLETLLHYKAKAFYHLKSYQLAK